MNKPENETLYFDRSFLDADRLDAVRAYLELTHWPNPEHQPHVEAGFSLTEEGQGHYCIYDSRDDVTNNLPKVRGAAVKVIAALHGLVKAIDAYEAEHPWLEGKEG